MIIYKTFKKIIQIKKKSHLVSKLKFVLSCKIPLSFTTKSWICKGEVVSTVICKGEVVSTVLPSLVLKLSILLSSTAQQS